MLKRSFCSIQKCYGAAVYKILTDICLTLHLNGSDGFHYIGK